MVTAMQLIVAMRAAFGPRAGSVEVSQYEMESATSLLHTCRSILQNVSMKYA